MPQMMAAGGQDYDPDAFAQFMQMMGQGGPEGEIHRAGPEFASPRQQFD
jgi:hypothetical protein